MKKTALTNALVFCISLFLVSCILTIILLEARERTVPLPADILHSSLFDGCRVEKFVCDITAYCPEACCNSGFVNRNGETIPVDWTDLVAAGGFSMKVLHERGVDFAAVDTRLIPLGSILEFEGKYYVALDRGSSIKGERVDLAFPTHQEADAFGIKQHRDIVVFIPNSPGEILKEIKASVYAR